MPKRDLESSLGPGITAVNIESTNTLLLIGMACIGVTPIILYRMGSVNN